MTAFGNHIHLKSGAMLYSRFLDTDFALALDASDLKADSFVPCTNFFGVEKLTKVMEEPSRSAKAYRYISGYLRDAFESKTKATVMETVNLLYPTLVFLGMGLGWSESAEKMRFSDVPQDELFSVHVAGSIRRGATDPNDIDLVISARNIDHATSKIDEWLTKVGGYPKLLAGGDKQRRYELLDVQIDLYFTPQESLGAMLLHATGSKGYNNGLRKLAGSKGWRLNQYGLFDQAGAVVAQRTEEEIFGALGKEWRKPERQIVGTPT